MMTFKYADKQSPESPHRECHRKNRAQLATPKGRKRNPCEARVAPPGVNSEAGSVKRPPKP